jgi:hypothetical protein
LDDVEDVQTGLFGDHVGMAADDLEAVGGPEGVGDGGTAEASR